MDAELGFARHGAHHQRPREIATSEEDPPEYVRHLAPPDPSPGGGADAGSPFPDNLRPDSNQSGSSAARTGWSQMFTTPVHRRQASLVAESTPLTSMRQYFLLPAEDSVYSYFLFMPPVDQRRTKRWVTPLICFAFVLVIINFVMQVGLLVVVGDHIKNKHGEWVSRIVHIKHAVWYHIIPMPYNYPPPACRNEDSTLCMDKGDGISCAPPSIHLLTNWDLLDSDGDGVWTRDEAANEKLRETVQCDYGADLLSVYNNIALQLNASHVLKGRRDTDLFSGVGVHKAYFNWYLHKPLLCQYGDSDMCGPLFQRGFFDEALRQQPSNEFADASAALKYCNNLLQHECFNILPTTYKVWRSRSYQQCGERLFGQSMYKVPEDSSGTVGSVPMLTVSFRIQDIYETTKGISFRIFLCILLVTFLSVMFLEMRSIMKVMGWVINFPTDLDAGLDGNVVGKRAVRIRTDKKDDDGSDEDDQNKYEAISKTIFAVRKDHRFIVGLMTVMRMCLWVFLLWSGIMFLTGQPRYLTLIFDALSLVFIFEIDELLYKTMLRHEFKMDHLGIDDLKVRNIHGGWITGRKTVMLDILQFLGIIVFGMCIVYEYCGSELNPLIDALSCLCSKEGPRCHDAQHFSKSWWDNYWAKTMPAANLIIDQLKAV